MLAERIKTEIRDRFGTSFEFSKRVKRLNLLIRFAIGNLKPKKGNSKQNIEASWTDRSRNLPNRDSSNAQGLMANQNDDRVRHLSFFPIDFFKNVHLNHIFKHFQVNQSNIYQPYDAFFSNVGNYYSNLHYPIIDQVIQIFSTI